MKNKLKLGWKGNLFLALSTLMGVIFLPTTTILAIGMLPTLAAFLIDKTRGHVRTLTIGAMNLAGCIPFILEIWKQGHEMSVAFEYLLQPKSIVIIYVAAGIGYLIDWAMTGIVIGLMSEKGQMRLKQIAREHEMLVKRWGREVTGKIPLDAYGFAVSPSSEEEDSGAKATGEKGNPPQ